MDSLHQFALGLARRAGLTPADCDDVAQEAVLRRLRGGDAVADERAFTARITARLVIDHFRRRARERTHRNGSAQPAVVADAVESADRPPDVDRLYKAIARLPARQAAVITLRKLWELDYDQVAAVLHTSPENCRSLCRHALARLRRLLEHDAEDAT